MLSRIILCLCALTLAGSVISMSGNGVSAASKTTQACRQGQGKLYRLCISTVSLSSTRLRILASVTGGAIPFPVQILVRGHSHSAYRTLKSCRALGCIADVKPGTFDAFQANARVGSRSTLRTLSVSVAPSGH